MISLPVARKLSPEKNLPAKREEEKNSRKLGWQLTIT
jgi:hypothetical protein